MIFALAALLLPPVIPPQAFFHTEKMELIAPGDPSSSSPTDGVLPLSQIHAEMLVQPPDAPGASVEPPTAPAAAMASPEPILFAPSKPMTVSVAELRAETRRNDRRWLTLGAAAHSAATFDAWSTRHAITTAGAQEQDPLFKPFAGNPSIYFAIQAGPALMDYFGRKMMYSRHSWLRHLWWVPQSASMAGSLFCGAHNLGVRAPGN